VAKGVKLVGVKVVNCAGGTTATAIAAGIDWVARWRSCAAADYIALTGPVHGRSISQPSTTA
ncbi:hypothetical protein ABZ070_36140, partial [Streptomyces sp. NPDC006283]